MEKQLEYVIVATKPSGKVVVWTGRGFSADPSKAMRCLSLDFADLTVTMESREHPHWTDWKLRVSEAN